MLSVILFVIYFTAICLLLDSLHSEQQSSWWIRITSYSPDGVYYFGPFDSWDEAESKQTEYIETIKYEGAAAIISQIKQCQPQQLPVYQDNLYAY